MFEKFNFKQKMHNISMPWLMIFVFPVLSSKYAITEIIRIELSYLCIPLAAYCGHRYGKPGIVAVAIGGLLLPVGIHLGPGSFPNDLAVYLISLAVAILCTADRQIVKVIPTLRLSASFIAIFIILPLSVWFYHSGSISIGFSLLPLFYFGVLLLGISETKQSLVFFTLVIATAIGTLLEILDLSKVLYDWLKPDFRYFRLHYTLDSPVDLFTALAYFMVGRYLNRLSKSDGGDIKTTPRPWILLSFLLILWCGELPYLLIPYKSEFYKPLLKLKLMGSFFAIPLASFFAGAAYRFKGIALALAISFLLPATEWAIRVGFGLEYMRLYLYLHLPIYCFAYAALGLRVGDQLRGVQTVWSPWAWVGYVGLVILAVPMFIGADDLRGIISAFVVVICLIGFGALARKIRRLAVESQASSAGNSWISLAGLVLFAIGFLSNIQGILGKLKETAAAVKGFALFVVGMNKWWDMTNSFMLAVVVFFYLSIIFIALTELFKGFPSLLDELSNILKWLKKRFRFDDRLIEFSEEKETISTNAKTGMNKYVQAATRTIAVARNIIVSVTFVLIVFLILQILDEM